MEQSGNETERTVNIDINGTLIDSTQDSAISPVVQNTEDKTLLTSSGSHESVECTANESSNVILKEDLDSPKNTPLSRWMDHAPKSIVDFVNTPLGDTPTRLVWEKRLLINMAAESAALAQKEIALANLEHNLHESKQDLSSGRPKNNDRRNERRQRGGHRRPMRSARLEV